MHVLDPPCLPRRRGQSHCPDDHAVTRRCHRAERPSGLCHRPVVARGHVAARQAMRRPGWTIDPFSSPLATPIQDVPPVGH